MNQKTKHTNAKLKGWWINKSPSLTPVWSPVLDRAFQVKQPWCSRATSLTRGVDFVLNRKPAFRIKKVRVSFAVVSRLCHKLCWCVPPQFEVKLFMNQLVVAVQLEGNIIGRQLWIGSFFARPCCERGLVCRARTSRHSPPKWVSAVGNPLCVLGRWATLPITVNLINRQKISKWRFLN